MKQDAINLFLGLYIPSKHSIPLWELESDYHLHNSHLHSSTKVELVPLKKYDLNHNETRDDDTQTDSPSDRLEIVKEKFRVQVNTLSSWWKLSLQFYISQRMWLKHEPPEDFLTDYAGSFDRIYQPEKLTQFDKYFARSWSMPSRLSHEASLVNDNLAGHRKNKTINSISESNDCSSEAEDRPTTLSDVFLQRKVISDVSNEKNDAMKSNGESKI